MTKDEAILLYTGKAKMISRIIDSKKLGSDDPEILSWWECNLIQHEELIEALKGPQPDAETGLMPCGCGGKAELCPVNDYYTARCERCRITSDYYKTAKETIAAWNKALG